MLAAGAGALEVPYLAGRVNDYAGMIDADAEARITTKLESFETATGSQVAVLTMDTLAGDSLEEFSHRVAETWGLGREKVDDGVLLLVVKNDRKMRIEVGYGLEPDLTDAESGRILRNVLRPQFKEGRFSQGIEVGVDTILATLEGAEVPAPGETSRPRMDLPGRMFGGLIFLAVMGPFALSALFGKGLSGWFLYFFLMPFWATFPSALIHPKAGIGLLLGWIVFFPIFKLFLSRTAAGKRWMEVHPGWGSWGSGRGGGFSGGGFSGGGFSGGGGSFGGGGASGSW